MTNEPLHVLLVDDDAADAELTQISLSGSQSRHFQVTHANRVSRAVECLRSGVFDALLLDLGLPDSQGLATLASIRKENSEVPIVVLTGLSDEKTALESLNRGAQDYLVKDVANPQTLERSICYAIQRQRQHRALATTNEQLAQKNQWLQTLNETARQFVDNVSHDFRTPLTVIREFTSILREGLSGPVNDKQQEFLGIVMSRVDDLALMVDDLLDTSKLESGLLGIWRRSAQASEIIDHVKVLIDRRAEAAEITLEYAVEDSLPPVYCDVEKIGRVIVNLAVNAIKFTPPSGRVCVWAKRTPNSQEVCIGVRDNGPGIASENLAAIFDRFKQVGRRVDAGDKGFGLGLSIVRELVHLNLGTVRVESSLGHGSTFSFVLPVADPSLVFDRYLNVVTELPVTSAAFCSSMSLLTAEIGPEGDAKLHAAADGFLQTTVGTYDLVYRLDERRWVMAVRRSQEEINALTQQIEREWAEFGESRPSGALPGLRLEVRGSWRIDRRRAELIEAFHSIVHPSAGLKAAKRVLLVDDDADLVESLRIRMRAAGFDVFAARDGKEGLERASSDRPDVIVLDVRMPVLDGVSALRELKRREDTRRIPVVMLSACIGERQLSKELGARFFIQKPFDSAAVISAIETSLAEACLAC